VTTRTPQRRLGESANAAPTPAGSTPLHIDAAIDAARAEQGFGRQIGFALVTRDGRTLGSWNAGQHTYGASISKAMLLVAYLRQTGEGQLSDLARSELTAMIEVSDNDAADWVFAHLNSARNAVLQVAVAAGMRGFELDTSDSIYVLGQSRITAGDFARFFARIGSLMPAEQRTFGLYLLSHVEQRTGLLDAQLPGIVYAKEGWKPEPDGLPESPYIVNQAARFAYKGKVYGVAVTVGGVGDQDEGESIVKRIVSRLL
jgi:hypothetical protein